MKIILSDKQISAAWEIAEANLGCPQAKWADNDTKKIDMEHGKCVARAQAYHILKVLYEPCDKHAHTVRRRPSMKLLIEYYDCGKIWYWKHRYLCPDCMKEIEEELK